MNYRHKMRHSQGTKKLFVETGGEMGKRKETDMLVSEQGSLTERQCISELSRPFARKHDG